MIEINLLPKEYLKNTRSFSLGKTGLYMLAGVGAMIVVMSGLTLFQMNKLNRLEANTERANERAAMLRQDIALVDGLTDVKTKITRRMRAVEALDRHRSAYVRILEDVARTVPEFVWLGGYEEIPPKATKEDKGSSNKKNAAGAVSASTITANVKQVEIEGYAFTLNALAAYMIRMMRSNYFEKVELVSTEETELFGEKSYHFVVSCDVHFLSEEDLKSLAAAENQSKDSRGSRN